MRASRSVTVRQYWRIHFWASATGSAETSVIVRPPTRTAALSGRSRLPPHVAQGRRARYSW